MTETPIVHAVTRHAGIAGQFSLTATVQYPGESPTGVTFYGSTYGGPIVMEASTGLDTVSQIMVSSAVLDRLGRTLDEAWVRRFFAPREDSPRDLVQDAHDRHQREIRDHNV